MENALNISFEDSEETRSLFSEAGVSGPGHAKVLVEVDVTELGEEGVMAVPTKVLEVTSPEATDDDDDDDDEGAEDKPGMVVVMEGRGKKGAES